MGQTISRRLAGRLEKGMQRHRQLMEEDALKNIAEKKQHGTKYTDPNALYGGFQRGEGPQILKDAQQQAFLEQQEKGGSDNAAEMPEDLIKFLNDVGPLQRKVDKDFTSPRLRKQLDELEEEPEDPHRQLRDMPLMEDSDFSTTRTTNFSTNLEQDIEEDKGLTDEELYKLLQNTPTNLESVLETKTNLTEAEKDERLELMRRTLQYMSLPVLMKETDNYIGTRADRVEELEKIYKLKKVPEDRVKLYLAVATEEENNEEKNDDMTSKSSQKIE